MSSDAATAGGGPAAVQDPTDLERSDYLAALKRTLRQIKQDDVSSLAAGVAFRMFLSLFPSLFAAVAIFSLVTTPGEIGELIGNLRGVMPREAIDLIRQPLRDLATTGEGRAGLAAVAGIAGGLFAAIAAALALMKALSRAYNVPETRKFVAARITALLLTLALVGALVSLVLLLVAGPQMQDALLPDFAPPIDFLLGLLRGLLALGVLLLLFAFVYWIGPNRDRPSWEWMSPGALLGVVAWLFVSAGFTVYVQTAGNYNATYGTLAGVVVLLLWLQLSMLAVLVGAEFNAEVERTRSLRLAVEEGSGSAETAPSGALLAGDQEAGASAIAEGRVEAAMMAPADPEKAGDVEVPAPVPPAATPTTAGLVGPSEPQPTPASQGETTSRGLDATLATPVGEVPAKRLGALAAGVMAVAVFLGLAKRAGRRGR